MRVMVTGHRGYVGSVLVPELLRRGHDVKGLDADLFLPCTYADAGAPVPAVRKDIRDARAPDFAGMDAVIHLAALCNDPLGNLDEAVTMEVNRRAAVRVAEAAREAGVSRFLFASSCSVYGAAGGEPVDECSACRPVSAYARSKLEAEREIAALSGNGFRFLAFRAGTAYGYSPLLRFDLVVNNFAAWAVATGRIPVRSDGAAWRPIVHVRDIARAFAHALEAPPPSWPGMVLNLGFTRENYRVRDLARAVAASLPGSRVEQAADGAADRRCYRVDCGRLEAWLPAWRPALSLEEGVRDICRRLRRQGVAGNQIDHGRYSRIGHIRRQIRRGRLGKDLRWRN